MQAGEAQEMAGEILFFFLTPFSMETSGAGPRRV
jgi:hypothetical protein